MQHGPPAIYQATPFVTVGGLMAERPASRNRIYWLRFELILQFCGIQNQATCPYAILRDITCSSTHARPAALD